MTLHFRRMRKYHPRRSQKEIKLIKENSINLELKKEPEPRISSKNETKSAPTGIN